MYRLGLLLYKIAIHLAALFGNKKAKRWISGRKNWKPPSIKEPAIWMHAASLGEFEQGKPVLEALRAQLPHTPVLVTFFSPSGYEARKDYDVHVHYLPLDSPANARKLLDSVPIRVALFVKYEFWKYYLLGLKHRKVPTYLISACIGPRSSIFRWPKLYKPLLRCYNHIFCQDEGTRQLLKQHFSLTNVSVSGDTRFDRALEVRSTEADFGSITDFIKGRKCIVAGSTYPPEEQVLAAAPGFEEFALILAPHNVEEGHITQIEQLFGKRAVRFSRLTSAAPANVLIIDTIGILARLYRVADISYVGGGFRDGIHNILESAVYGCFTLYGPMHDKFPEGKALEKAGGGKTLNQIEALPTELLAYLNNPTELEKGGTAARLFIESGAGATQLVSEQILVAL